MIQRRRLLMMMESRQSNMLTFTLSFQRVTLLHYTTLHYTTQKKGTLYVSLVVVGWVVVREINGLRYVS